MSKDHTKIIAAFKAAHYVTHYYWMHTDGDDYERKEVSIENIQKIVAVMTGTKIRKWIVAADSRFFRSFVERYSDGKDNHIYVMENEPIEWQRFGVVKELCHILIDQADDFQPDPRVTIEGLKTAAGYFAESSPNEIDSEHLAEIIALELIYPVEHRRDDLQSGKTPEEIAADRRLPDRYVYRGLDEKHYKMCLEMWKSPPPVDPPNLDDKF